ncbi:MAG: cell division protein FtsQ/DivIB [Gracilibacteraceae bacterium]|jgi:cell division protein FtsQ|nr:cell division protein FtsQ/DivIB [Gracilibacteraceae bacterium]
MKKKKWLSPLTKAMLLCLAMLCFFLFVRSQFFAITAIRTEGLVQLRENDVLRLAGVEAGDNLFLAETEALTRKVEMNPLVADAEVVKNFPGGLIIRVTERTPAALILKEGGSSAVEVDRQGFVLRVYESWPSGSLPVVTGLEETETPAPGKQINSGRLVSVLNMLRQMPPDIAPMVGEININNAGQIVLFLTSGIEARLGRSEQYEGKFAMLLELVSGEGFDATAAGVGYIDLTSSKPVLGGAAGVE